jgi:hypothetical protein
MSHIRLLQTDPNYRQHVFGYGQQPPAPAQAAKPPEDPLEAFKMEIRQEVIRELAPQFAPLAEAQKVIQAKMEVNRVKQSVVADPLRQDVHGEIHNFLNSLPGHVEFIETEEGQVVDPSRSYGPRGEQAYRLDNDPRYYTTIYGHYRGQVEEKKKTAPPEVELPAAARKEKEHAPYLERGGAVSGEAVTEEVKKREKAKELRREMRRNPGNMKAVGDYLEASGLIDHLL